MRIALVGNEYHPQLPLAGYGGIESSVETLAFGLHRAGHDFFCVVPGHGQTVALDYPFPVLRTRYVAAALSGRSHHEFIAEVAALLPTQRPDVIWSQSHWSVRPLAALGIPVIVTCQDSRDKPPGWLVEHPNLHYRFISRFQRARWATEPWERRRSFFAYTGLGDEEYALEPHKGEHYLWVGGLGWGWRAKGLSIFVGLARRNPDKRFVAYGSGRRYVTLLARLAALGLPNFEFRGELPRGPAHREAFARARALVMPTQLPEALGRTTLEALSKGTPVLASANGALPELIDGENGVATNDAAVLQAALDHRYDPHACFRSAQRFHVSHEVRRMVGASRMIRGGTLDAERLDLESGLRS